MWPFRRKRRFRVEGGRAGLIHFEDGARRGELSWEMLASDDADVAIYGDSCTWTAPERRAMGREEVRALAQAFASEHKARVELGFSGGWEKLRP